MPQLNLAIHRPRMATSPCMSIQRERGIGNVIQLNQLKMVVLYACASSTSTLYYLTLYSIQCTCIEIYA